MRDNEAEEGWRVYCVSRSGEASPLRGHLSRDLEVRDGPCGLLREDSTCKGPEVSALWVFKEPQGTMWLEWCMMGDGVRELTGARCQAALSVMVRIWL